MIKILNYGFEEWRYWEKERRRRIGQERREEERREERRANDDLSFLGFPYYPGTWTNKMSGGKIDG